MFDSLLGPKFSNKCKHSVKSIRCRMETIGKKKHATVRYLEKVIADLISSGNDTNAFGRTDALLSEINQAWCYDMIEKYCCCIVEHLPTMQKERECPEETMEAVATLIFAAARFSDLPELVDLRRLFTARYGSNMESCINSEFVEKMQKSFSQDKKLQLMQEIVQEYRVNWEVKSFEHTVSNSSAHTFDQPRMHFSSSNEINKQSHTSDGRREVSDRSEMDNGREAEHNSRSAGHKQQKLLDECRNFHTTHNTANAHLYDSTEKIEKVATYESENIEPHYFSKGFHDTSVVIERQGRNDKAANMIPPYSKFTGDFNVRSSSQYSFVHYITEMEHNGQEKQHNEAEIPENNYKASNLKPPYVKPMANKTPLATGYEKTRNYEVYGSREYEDNLKNTPFSARMKNLEQAMDANSDSSNEDDMYMDVNNQQSFITSQSLRIEDDPICGAIRHGRHMYRTFSDQPRHGMYHNEGGNEPQTHSIIDREQASAANADSFGEDGDNQKSCFSSRAKPMEDDSICGVIYHGRRMYRAFSDQPRHDTYSGEGVRNEPQTYSMVELAGAQEQTIMDEVNSKLSANSLPRASLTPTEIPVRKQVRSFSMQPDRLRSNGGRLHRELPDYDDLAARIAALRNS